MAKNETGVNYIKHLLAISEKFIDDERLGPLHVSLYYALFQSWNLSRFRNPISINREEMMRASKIGSANTYTKCLKELDAWNYIKYLPSHNSHKGSQIYLYNFNKITDNATDISIDKGTDKTTEKTTVNELIPSINSLNNSNSTKHQTLVNEPTKNNSNEKINSSEDGSEQSGSEKKEKLREKKKVPLSIGEGRRGEAPFFEEVQNYFIEKKYPALEAEKFFYHYESNGWLVGKTPMQNWQAAAENWMIKAQLFGWGKVNPAPGNLHTSNDKNYGEPL